MANARTILGLGTLMVVSAGASCRAPREVTADEDPTGRPAVGGTAGTEGGSDAGAGGAAAGQDGGGAGAGASAGKGDGGTGASGGEGGEGGNGGDAGGGGGDAGSGATSCVGPSVRIKDIVSDDLADGTEVRLLRAKAESRKFLVSQTGSACIWGAMLSDSADVQAEPHLGLLAIEFAGPGGDPADPSSECRASAKTLPEDLTPGDVLALAGRIGRYAPNACAGTRPELQLVLDAGCPPRVLSHEALTATLLSLAEANAVAAGDETALLRYAGARVRLESISAARDASDGDGVGAYGLVSFEETTLTLGNKLYYNDLTAGGPGASLKRPQYAYPTAFESVEGIVRLDYCTWRLGAVDRCAATEPPSAGCP